MDAQLRLLPPTDPTHAPAGGAPRARSASATPAPTSGASPAPGWHLDDDARAIGRQGVARARQALQSARRATHDGTSNAA